MAYGDKRTYRKIDIYVRNSEGEWVYVKSTTWSRSCAEAKTHFLKHTDKWTRSQVRACFHGR